MGFGGEGEKFAATMNDLQRRLCAGREQEIGGSEMQKMNARSSLEKASSLLKNGVVNRVLGWKAATLIMI